MRQHTDLEATIAFQLRVLRDRLPAHEEPVTEYTFHDTRKWRFDFAFPSVRIAIECEGGTWSDGRHTRGQGFEDDCIKYNEAACLGWIVIRMTSGMIERGDLEFYLRSALLLREVDALRQAHPASSGVARDGGGA